MIDFFKKYPFRKRTWGRNFSVEDYHIRNLSDGIYYAIDNWDDFGYKTTIVLKAKIEGHIYDLGDLKFSYLPYNIESQNSVDLQEIVESEKVYNIVSIGDKKYYSFLNTFLEKADREIFFTLLGDLAYDLQKFQNVLKEDHRYLPPPNENYDLLKDSLLRFHSKAEVEIQLHRLSHGGNYKEKYEINLFDLEGREIFKFSKDPDNVNKVPDSLYAIVGNNGAGKTRFIKNLVDLYIKNKSELFQLNFDLTNFNQIILISFSPFDSGFDKEDKENYKFIGLNFNRTVTLNSEESFERSIELEIESKLKEVLNNTFRNLFYNIIDRLSFDPWFSTLRLANENEGTVQSEISDMSSGQKIILLNVLNLILKVKERTLVIIDEPELFLHPPILKAYIRAIEEIVDEENGACLLATHSAIVLQEIPHTNIRKLEYNPITKIGKVTKLKIKTFGENSSFINDSIFGTDLRNTGFYKYIIDTVNNSPDYLETLKYILGSEALLIKTIEEERNVQD